MPTEHLRRSAFVLVCALIHLAIATDRAAAQERQPASGAEPATRTDAELRRSVVSISVQYEARDPSTPWKREGPQEVGGSGVVIEPGLILTNAHVVEQGSEILIESDRTSLPVQAELYGLDESRDLALLKVSDEAFIAAHPPIPILEGLPKDGARVVVMGYPIGGDSLSTTSGVISRIEWSEIGMEGEDGMRVQVDAAINSGNSGGPAFVDGKVAGLAFSGRDDADNVAYLIATEEIARFRAELAAGTIDGNGISSLVFQTLENPALRAKLGASGDVAGVVVVEQKGGPLEPWDVVTKVNGYEVDNRGQIAIEEGRKVSVECAIGRFEPVDGKSTVPVEFIRDGTPSSAELPVFSRATRMLASYPDGNYPYLVYGPLVFSPLHRDLLVKTEGWMLYGVTPINAALFDERPSGGRQFVAVASPLLSSPIGRGYEVSPGQTVKSVNGRTVANFAAFVELLAGLKDEYVVFEFNEINMDRLVFRRAEIEAATEKVMESNGIRRQCSKDVERFWKSE